MPDLQSDIIGRVNRLPIRPNEKGALLPLMEAISNSVFAITERFGEDSMRQGKIVVRVIRKMDVDDQPVIGFDIEDNGVGFTKSNYIAFLTPDSRHKEAKGGKGVGRLAWLKVFREISVESTFIENDAVSRREFKFKLQEKNQVEEVPTGVGAEKEIRTVVRFRDFDSRFSGKCPSKTTTLANRIVSHFVPLFVAGNAPKIIIDDIEQVDIEANFADSIVDQQTDKISIQIDDEPIELNLWHLKCKRGVKFDNNGNNFAFITGNNRSVVDYCIDEQLGLKLLEGEFVYIGCVFGPYLDQHVNAERTAFTLDADEITEIKRSVSRQAKEFLKAYIEESIAQKVRTTREVISENPQFMYVVPEIKEFAQKLQPNSYKKEDIFIELSRDRFRRHKKIDALEKEIAGNPVIDEALNEKIQQYQSFIRDEKKGALAEYVIRRKAVLDIMEKLLEYKDQEKETYQREDALHQLICPMKIDSNRLAIDDHNLWLIDDRLAFFNYFSSDIQLNKYSDVDSEERPDLAFFYDSCVAWRDTENADTVVIIEFKKPMREDYSKGKDPIQQVLGYVKRLKEESSVPDITGKPIRGINGSTAFHCYIIADITSQLEEKIIGRLQRTPDGFGYFGYQTNPTAFVEIIPYSKVLNDARLRNTIFFQKLGITNSG